MPRGYRCIIIALVGVALAAAAQQPTKQHHGNQGADKSETTKPPEPPYSPYPDQNADACYRAQNHDAADLCAQWRAAIAAEKAAIAGEKSAHEARRATGWAIAATFLTLATVIGLIVSIYQTFGALGEARRGNLIAQRANARSTRRAIAGARDTERALEISERNAVAVAEQLELGRETREIELRAYIRSLEERLERNPANPLSLRFVLPFKNVGQTPAQAAVTYIRTWFVTYPSKLGGRSHLGGKPSKVLHHGRARWGTVAKEAEFTVSNEYTFSRTRMNQMLAGKGVYYIDTTTYFTDEFDVDWVYHHMFYVSADALRRNAVHTHFCATERRREVNQDGEGEEPLEDDGDHESEPDSPEE